MTTAAGALVAVLSVGRKRVADAAPDPDQREYADVIDLASDRISRSC